jgi:hypothetical protein
MRLCFLGEGGAELIEKTFQTHTGQKNALRKINKTVANRYDTQ